MTTESTTFATLGLPAALLEALSAVGYETPSPIQAQTIPPLLEGRDVLGQAQTGTGKTAAFALPLLARIDLSTRFPQALVLTPTRELAIQVAEALQKYAARLPGFHVLPIYGGQSYGPQLSALRRGVHAIVGTPGRVIDHLERGSLKLDTVRTMVLDEADEMLRMGFIEDVEKILQKTPAEKQVALFSATMPSQVRRIAQTYLREPAEVTIAAKTRTATTVRQRCLVVPPPAKLDALTRILEIEPFDAMIVFARTKVATEELADKLAARGYAVAALNGDVPQQQRERTVNKLKDGGLDIVVATDVAARGLDVERISHVLNYDAPTDPESYVHRIGRTGRAGRSGEAILFIAPRERNLLAMIERTTRKHIEVMRLPTDADVDAQRSARFRQQVLDILQHDGKLAAVRALIADLEAQAPLADVAAALAVLAQSSSAAAPPARGRSASADTTSTQAPAEGGGRPPRPASLKPVFLREQDTSPPPQTPFADAAPPPREKPKRRERENSEPMELFRIEVGHDHGAQPKHIVGAIANEAGLDSHHIGRVDIRGDHSLIELPEGMPKNIFQHLRKVWVAGRRLEISRADGRGAAAPSRPAPRKPQKKPRKPPRR
ncbi:MAG: DEAD/DEAH box helicase [Sinimarinibacterium flocculans]|uniref:ATP-dependent RNA helicase DeaD n=1 Tax=Sinimarinibacterium flocculans TaxID=985250 RepID=A0A318E8Y9_9GAMM|nr:DEAD/DEAH box helicase [Sinimarinibacterium flocculans]PXV65760.1 ATP-dependent RNA helicase CsdA [Sinimarinibacterium flocculans]